MVNNTTGSGTGTGVVTVSGTGTLGGSGRVTGNITVESGGATHPGNSRIFSAVNLEYKTGSTAKFTLGAPVSLGTRTAGQDYDQIDLTGNLKIGTGATLQLQLTASSLQYLHDPDGGGAGVNYFLFTLDSAPITGRFDFLSLMLDGSTYTQSILDGRATFSEFDLVFDLGYTGNAGLSTLTGGNDLTLHAASVPEPLTGWLLVMGGAGVILQRRRRPVVS